ncbi:hypothetical protein KP509_34G030600 [Ceratopteris richardii]|nr:hypothetical protein KP509_34G030600 [Ceratopteris richardii]
MVRRGQDLWSRFIDMDNLWSTPHVSAMEDNFFTLDLDFLNKEVEKVDIAERLLVDAKYIPLEEREKSQHSSKALAEKDEEILNPDVVTFDNVDTNQYPSSAPLRMVNNSPNTVSSDSGVKRESNFSMGFHEETQNDTEIHADSFHTRSFGSDRHAAKEAFVQSQSARDTFDAESAEAELDALLDIIDNKSAGKTFDSRLVEPDASPRSSVVAPTESYTRILQGKGSASISVHTLHTAQAEILIQTKASENTFHNMVEATKLPVSLGDGSSQLSVVESTRSVPKANVDQDFDEWLDSL